MTDRHRQYSPANFVSLGYKSYPALRYGSRNAQYLSLALDPRSLTNSRSRRVSNWTEKMMTEESEHEKKHINYLLYSVVVLGLTNGGLLHSEYLKDDILHVRSCQGLLEAHEPVKAQKPWIRHRSDTDEVSNMLLVKPCIFSTVYTGKSSQTYLQISNTKIRHNMIDIDALYLKNWKCSTQLPQQAESGRRCQFPCEHKHIHLATMVLDF